MTNTQRQTIISRLAALTSKMVVKISHDAEYKIDRPAAIYVEKIAMSDANAVVATVSCLVSGKFHGAGRSIFPFATTTCYITGSCSQYEGIAFGIDFAGDLFCAPTNLHMTIPSYFTV